jgi:hypothetical protein
MHVGMHILCSKLNADHRSLGQHLKTQGRGGINANMRNAGISLDLLGSRDQNCVRSYVPGLTALLGTKRKAFQHPVRVDAARGGASDRSQPVDAT